MCLIIVKKEGKSLVSKQMIEEVWYDNPHGAGLIYRRAGTSTFKMVKGLMFEDDLHNEIKRLQLTDKDFIAYHLRWATSGEIDEYNTHPFVVHQDAGRVKALRVEGNSDKTMFVMHNGVIYDLNDKKAKVSDTIRFVSEYLSNIKTHDIFKNIAMKSMIEKFIDGSRLLITHNSYGYVTYGDWHEHDGYLLSKEYTQATKSTNGIQIGHNKYWNYWENQSVSGKNLNQIGLEFCDYCGSCDKKENIKFVHEYNAHMCKECVVEFNIY